jgi:hypothetical protein
VLEIKTQDMNMIRTQYNKCRMNCLKRSWIKELDKEDNLCYQINQIRWYNMQKTLRQKIKSHYSRECILSKLIKRREEDELNKLIFFILIFLFYNLINSINFLIKLISNEFKNYRIYLKLYKLSSALTILFLI